MLYEFNRHDFDVLKRTLARIMVEFNEIVKRNLDSTISIRSQVARGDLDIGGELQDRHMIVTAPIYIEYGDRYRENATLAIVADLLDEKLVLKLITLQEHKSEPTDIIEEETIDMSAMDSDALDNTSWMFGTAFEDEDYAPWAYEAFQAFPWRAGLGPHPNELPKHAVVIGDKVFALKKAAPRVATSLNDLKEVMRAYNERVAPNGESEAFQNFLQDTHDVEVVDEISEFWLSVVDGTNPSYDSETGEYKGDIVIEASPHKEAISPQQLQTQQRYVKERGERPTQKQKPQKDQGGDGKVKKFFKKLLNFPDASVKAETFHTAADQSFEIPKSCLCDTLGVDCVGNQSLKFEKREDAWYVNGVKSPLEDQMVKIIMEDCAKTTATASIPSLTLPTGDELFEHWYPELRIGVASSIAASARFVKPGSIKADDFLRLVGDNLGSEVTFDLETKAAFVSPPVEGAPTYVFIPKDSSFHYMPVAAIKGYMEDANSPFNRVSMKLSHFEEGMSVTVDKGDYKGLEGVVSFVGAGPNGDKIAVQLYNSIEDVLGPVFIDPKDLTPFMEREDEQ